MKDINQSSANIRENSEGPSKVTLKNYAADTRKFIRWYESTYQRSFPPPVLTSEVAEAYLNPIRSSSPRSAKRYASSLRKFFAFLVEQGIITYNPLSLAKKTKDNDDIWGLRDYGNHLYNLRKNPVTIKNYLSDIKQFLSWAEKTTGTYSAQTNQIDIKAASSKEESSTRANPFAKIDVLLIEEYKNRLQSDGGFSPVSINRKLSSLRSYFSWADQSGLNRSNSDLYENISNIKTRIEKKDSNLNQNINKEADELTLAALKETSPAQEPLSPDEKADSSYSRFPPFRLFQKTKKGLGILFDLLFVISVIKAVESLKFNLWKAAGKEVFAPIPEVVQSLRKAQDLLPHAELSTETKITLPANNTLDRFIRMNEKDALGRVRGLPKSIYAPHKISTNSLPFWKKVAHHLHHTRPQWYRKYHSYPFVHYTHFGIALIIAVILGLRIYQPFLSVESAPEVLASQVGPSRQIGFQGKLEDEEGLPITKESNIRFLIYNSKTASESALLWQEVQTIKPDPTGSFSVSLGKNAPLRQNLFTDHPALFLGISIGTRPELTPREALASYGLSSNSKTLQGLKPITGNNAGTENVILALDSSGNLTIGGNANPIFQATGGGLSLRGEKLTLSTNPGSGGNIELDPDGTGIVDIRKPIQNTSEDDTLDPSFGAVQIDDSLAVNATSSAHSALQINQNGIGNLISAFANGSAKFTISNSGTATVAEDLKVFGNKLETATDTFSLADTTTTNLNIGGAAKSIYIGADSGTTVINHSLKVEEHITARKGLNLLYLSPGSIPFINGNNQLTSDIKALFWDGNNKRLGIGTTTPASPLAVSGLPAGAGTQLVVDANGNIFKSNSSRRYKKDINALDTDFSKILEVSPVSFTYTETGASDIGYLAEDFHKLGLKELVVYNSKGEPDAIKYDKLSVYIIENLKKQQKLLDSLSVFADNVRSGFLKVQNITVQSLSVASEDITIGTVLLRDYIKDIALEVVDKRLAEERKNQIVIVNPVVAEEASPSATMSPTPTPSPTKSPAPEEDKDPQSSSSATILNITNIYNNISSSSASGASPSAGLDTNNTPPATESAEIEPANPSATPTPTEVSSSQYQVLSTDNETDSAQEILNTKYLIPNTGAADIATFSAELYYVPNLNAGFGKFENGLISLGPTSLAEATISSQISIGENMKLSGTSIDTIGSDLNLQPLRQGNLSLMGGLVKIDTRGNLTVEGNAKFTGDVEIRGTLAAGIISPIAESDLVINLGNESRLAVQDQNGEGVLSINQKGDIISSGSGTFANFKIIRGAQADTSFTETVASASAGTAVITRNEIERTILTPFVAENSLIYITPVNDTRGVTPYIARQTPAIAKGDTRLPEGRQGSFTIQVPSPQSFEIKLNWIIIN
jgi:site-specific recombinase XerD